MPGMKEIKNHIESVRETQKITNAMYLIASTKLRKAKTEFDRTKPFFEALKSEIKRIFRIDAKIQSRYFYPTAEEPQLSGTFGYLVITADKGLAGAYNQNVLREAEGLMADHPNAKLFVVGEYGRQYFLSHGIPIEQSFLYTAQNPTLERAREICMALLRLYNDAMIEKLYVVYTDFGTGMNPKPQITRLLPFHRAQFSTRDDSRQPTDIFDFQPSIEEVLEGMIPTYVSGFIYSALVDSFCCEQGARMVAMESANRNAEELLESLRRDYNDVRQKTITQEITEIASGAKYQKLKKEEEGKRNRGTAER